MRKTIVIALILFVTFSNAWAENLVVAPPGNWNKVQSLPTNTKITIEMKYGEEVSGEFVRLAEDSIVVKEFEREKVFPRNAVALIKRMKPGSRARNAAISGGIFFGIGFGLGYAAAPGIADQDDLPGGERVSAGAGVGALIGGAAAAISLMHRPSARGEVIYKAR
jgi:hypothetical protein